MTTATYLVPTAETVTAKEDINQRVRSLEGLRVGFRIEWPRFELFARQVERRLREEYGVRETPEIHGLVTQDVHVYKKRADEWKEWHDSIDVAVLGLAA